MVAAELVLLREILAELRRINGTLTAGRPVAHNDVAVSELVRAIYSTIGDRLFSCGELLVHAETVQATNLIAAIVAVCGAMNARMVGKALARSEGRIFAALSVRRRGSDASGIVWQITMV